MLWWVIGGRKKISKFLIPNAPIFIGHLEKYAAQKRTMIDEILKIESSRQMNHKNIPGPTPNRTHSNITKKKIPYKVPPTSYTFS